ncbi:MAG: hypothetical protein SA378_11600 [Sedimentibacter sp.]|uniref:hypothetical protein n=1 Tax=Sedimentibacter sp. TaxID=1960295 RepID=UPI0029813431|nr:hypothetical protein [Sedimentibacter sp.]MDW5300760.1 hypothetical protein [Sedimentibacter sp.]
MKINNITVQAPLAENFKINPVEQCKTTRTASGRLVKNVIAIKNNYSLTYKGLRYSDYQTFLNVFLAGNSVPFTYLDNDIERTATVFIMSMPRGIYQDKSTISHGVTITLEEV